MAKKYKYQPCLVAVTGPYTAYLGALAARRSYQRQVKRDARALRALGEAQALYGLTKRSAELLHVRYLENLVDEEYQATLEAWGAVRTASADLELERDIAAEDWVAIG